MLAYLVGLDGQVEGGAGKVVDVAVGSREPDEVVVGSKPVEDLAEGPLVDVGNVVQVHVLRLLVVLHDLFLFKKAKTYHRLIETCLFPGLGSVSLMNSDEQAGCTAQR